MAPLTPPRDPFRELFLGLDLASLGPFPPGVSTPATSGNRPEGLATADVARLVGMSTSYVVAARRAGRLVGERVPYGLRGFQFVFTREAVDEWQAAEQLRGVRRRRRRKPRPTERERFAAAAAARVARRGY